VLNPEKIWCEHLTDLSTSPVTCSHFTLGNPEKSFFNNIIPILQIIYVISEENCNCCTAALAVYLLLFSASYYLHRPCTASGARYRKTAHWYRHVEACSSGFLQHLGWILAQRGVLFDWSLSKKTGSMYFESHRWQPTTGSLQSLQCLKERNKPSVRWKSFVFHKLLWWHFQLGWASGLRLVPSGCW